MNQHPYFVFCFLILAACQNNHELLKPQVKPLMEAVYASGFVVAKDEYEVYSQAEGYLSEKLIVDGEEVKKGDPLFIIEAEQQSARYRLAKANYEMAIHNYRENSPVLEELKASIQTSKTKMEYDSLNFVRYSNLIKSNATTRSEFDRMKLIYENARNEYSLQKSRYEKIRNQLYIEVQNAKSQLQITGDESKRSIVRSQVDGKVFKTMKEKGELVRRNEAIAVVGKDSLFYLQLSVDELDVQRVTMGQDVLVKIDAYPDKIFRARVTKIYPMINKQQQSIRVDADLTERLPGGFSGLALEANIIIRQKEKALVIPKTALLPGDSIKIKTADGIRKIKVVKGIETLDEVEIMEGLDSVGTLIVSEKN
jgi:HlyD family secretion protein